MTIHVVGAGLAGLACALDLARAGLPVVLHEAAPQAGGRCRSFHDPRLDRVIDNGSHLLLSANHAVRRHLRLVGAEAMVVPGPAEFPFLDLRDGRRWSLRPNRGRLPWWLWQPRRREPDRRARDYLAAAALAWSPSQATVADRLGPSPLFRTLWRPLSEAILNTEPAAAAAQPLWAVLAETLLRGEAACRPLLAPHGLGAALIDPALARLAALGVPLAWNHRLTDVGRDGLSFGDQRIALGGDSAAVLALPNHVAARLLTGLPALPTRAIVNAHFRLPAPAAALPGHLPFLGLIGGTAQWLFLRGDVLTATVSAADDLIGLPAAALAARLWADVAVALGWTGPAPPARVIKERRATIAHTPAALALRPRPGRWRPGLFLAGDWTATGLPCTVEGALRSGRMAAAAVLEAA